MQARGVPAAALLEPGVLEMYGAFRTLPKTNFVEVYQYLHSKPWVTPVEREVAELQSKVDNSGVEASPELLVDLRSARRRLRWFAFKRLQVCINQWGYVNSRFLPFASVGHPLASALRVPHVYTFSPR